MTTNIIATITFLLTTNVTEEFSDFARWEAEPPKQNEMGIVYGFSPPRLTKGVDPQTKYVTTTVKKVTTLSFDWCGARSVIDEEILAVDVQKFHRGWNEATNKPPISVTNSLDPAFQKWLTTPGIDFTNILWRGATNINAWITNKVLH